MTNNLIQFAKTLEPADLPSEDLRWIASTFGMDIAVAIADRLAGIPLYIPKRAMLRVKQLYARRHFKGNNVRALAMHLQVSQQTIRNWVSRRSNASQDPDNYPQLSLELDTKSNNPSIR